MSHELDLPAIIAVLIILIAMGGSAALWFTRLLMPRSSIQQDVPVPPWAIGWVNFGIFMCGLIVAVYLAQALGALFLVEHMPVNETGERELTPWLAVVSIILLQGPLLLVFYATRQYFPHQFSGQINSNPMSLKGALLRAAPTFLRFLPIIWISSMIWNGVLMILQSFDIIGDTPPQELIELFGAGGDPMAMALLVLFAVIGAPIVEELIFRGCLYRFLKSKTLIPFAQFFSGILFALMHGNLMSFGPLLIVGILLLAHVYEKEGNLKVAICFHALFNSFSLLMLLLMSQSDVMPTP